MSHRPQSPDPNPIGNPLNDDDVMRPFDDVDDDDVMRPFEWRFGKTVMRPKFSQKFT